MQQFVLLADYGGSVGIVRNAQQQINGQYRSLYGDYSD